MTKIEAVERIIDILYAHEDRISDGSGFVEEPVKRIAGLVYDAAIADARAIPAPLCDEEVAIELHDLAAYVGGRFVADFHKMDAGEVLHRLADLVDPTAAENKQAYIVALEMEER